MPSIAALSLMLAIAPPPAPAPAVRRSIWVSLADKQLPPGGVQPFHTPLSGKAIARRSLRRTEPGLVDVRDLPVDPSRIQGVLATGARFRTQSRWLNGISVDATDSEARRIARLPFVRGIWSLHPSRKSIADAPISLEGGAAGGDYGFMQAQLAQIGIPSMHARGFHGEGMVIGILDTGFNKVHGAFHSTEHPLSVLAEWDFVDNDADTGPEPGDPAEQHLHGTWILGTLAAFKPGEAVGSAYAAQFVLAKTEVVPSETPVEEDYYVAGLEFIEAQGADLATSSLGYIDWYTPSQLDGLTAITTRAVNIATANGLVCLTAAGNQGHDDDPSTNHLLAPADALSVISCGATDLGGATAWFTSDGPSADGRVKPELLACGISVATVHSTDATGYQALSGTSLATPLVAGATALVLQARPEYGIAAIRSALVETASDFTATGGPDPQFVRGFGLVRALDAARRSRPVEDINLDGAVNAQDLTVLLSAWGPCTDPDPATGVCTSDFNADGLINAVDLARLLSAWGN